MSVGKRGYKDFEFDSSTSESEVSGGEGSDDDAAPSADWLEDGLNADETGEQCRSSSSTSGVSFDAIGAEASSDGSGIAGSERFGDLSGEAATQRHQLIKGYQMAIQSAAILANENAQLRAENSRQKGKRGIKRKYIASKDPLTADTTVEPIGRPGKKTKEQNSGVVTTLSEPKKHAPSKCSICESGEHITRLCTHK